MKPNYAKRAMHRNHKNTGIRPETLEFEKWFKNTCPGRIYKMEYKVGPYRLDFADLVGMIDYELESFRSPHTSKRGVIHDSKRTDYLIKLGWTVCIISEDSNQWSFLWK